MAEVTAISVVVGLILGMIPALRWALSEPVSNARAIAAYVVVTVAGVIYLLVVGVNPLAADGTGVLTYLGAGATGYLLIDSASRTAAALPGGGT